MNELHQVPDLAIIYTSTTVVVVFFAHNCAKPLSLVPTYALLSCVLDADRGHSAT